MINTYTNTGDLSMRVVDGSANVKMLTPHTTKPGASYLSAAPITMAAGYKVQAAHGAASYTGSVLVSYQEV
ncbi:hypothetical protein EG834_17350 [bacterium]|nr:hypothetical protein [bacterium]